MVACDCNPSTWDAETGWKCPGQFELHSETLSHQQHKRKTLALPLSSTPFSSHHFCGFYTRASLPSFPVVPRPPEVQLLPFYFHRTIYQNPQYLPDCIHICSLTWCLKNCAKTYIMENLPFWSLLCVLVWCHWLHWSSNVTAFYPQSLFLFPNWNSSPGPPSP